MRLPSVRFSIGRCLAIVAVVTLALVPLNHPSRAYLGLLMYFKFGALVAAAFLARYGRDRDWWFGFATLGWSSILFGVPGLWNAVSFRHDGFDWFNLTNSLGVLLQAYRGDPPDGPSDFYFTSTSFAAVLQFWITMTLSFVGGYIALVLKSRAKDEEGESR